VSPLNHRLLLLLNTSVIAAGGRPRIVVAAIRLLATWMGCRTWNAGDLRFEILVKLAQGRLSI
jgi:hypothetical protein